MDGNHSSMKDFDSFLQWLVLVVAAILICSETGVCNFISH